MAFLFLRCAVESAMLWKACWDQQTIQATLKEDLMNRYINSLCLGAALLACASAAPPVVAAVLTYGDMDVLGIAVYPGDPTAGATLEGLAPDVVTFGTPELGHGFPFAPAGDYPGTDQIFAGSTQTGSHDGYSSSSPTAGPQVISLDYSSLVPAGRTVETLTLGIAADDFQFPAFGQPFVASLNGIPAVPLTDALNGIDLGGPTVQYFTIGISPTILLPSHVLTLSIDNGGDGGDGWAIDFLTVGSHHGPRTVHDRTGRTGSVWSSAHPPTVETSIRSSQGKHVPNDSRARIAPE